MYFVVYCRLLASFGFLTIFCGAINKVGAKKVLESGTIVQVMTTVARSTLVLVRYGIVL